MDENMLAILACPDCKGKLFYDKKSHALVCRFHRVAFPIQHDAPVLIFEQARPFQPHEVNS